MLICSGCDIGGHAWTGAHPACVSCLRQLDGTAELACQTCIDQVVTWAGEFVLWEESTQRLVLERLEKVRKGEL